MDNERRPIPNIITCYLSCGCTVGFRSRPTVGDEILCIRHNSPVRVIRKPASKSIRVA